MSIISRALGGGGKPKFTPPPPVPTRADPDIAKRAGEARRRVANASGREDTILTSGLGSENETFGGPRKKRRGGLAAV